MWVFVLCMLLAVPALGSYNGNYALSFDGDNDYLTIQSSYLDESLQDSWTLEAWINPTSSQQYFQLNIVGFPGRHPNLEYCGINNWQCQLGEPITQLRSVGGNWITIVGNASLITVDQWHHICGTWDNKTLSLYVDGVLDRAINPYDIGYTDARPCLDYDCEVGLQIGGYRIRNANGVFSNQYFRGMIDEVRVWKIGRSQQEIQSTMSKTISGAEPGLQYYWRFDEGFGSTVKSIAEDGYGLLGGGNLAAQPRWIESSAPITTDTPTEHTKVIIEKESSGAVLAGSLLSLFFLFGGVSVGGLLGWKAHEKRLLNQFRFPWEHERYGGHSLLRNDDNESHDRQNLLGGGDGREGLDNPLVSEHDDEEAGGSGDKGN